MRRTRLIGFGQIDLKNVVIKLKDNGSNNLTIKIGEGNFTWSEKKNRQYTLDRGVLDTVRDGDQVPVDVKFDATFEWYKGTGSAVTPADALKGEGTASGWASTGAACEPYAVNIELVNTPPCASGALETIVFSDFRWESLDFDIKAGTISCTGKCNQTAPVGTPTVDTP